MSYLTSVPMCQAFHGVNRRVMFGGGLGLLGYMQYVPNHRNCAIPSLRLAPLSRAILLSLLNPKIDNPPFAAAPLQHYQVDLGPPTFGFNALFILYYLYLYY